MKTIIPLFLKKSQHFYCFAHLYFPVYRLKANNSTENRNKGTNVFDELCIYKIVKEKCVDVHCGATVVQVSGEKHGSIQLKTVKIRL